MRIKPDPILRDTFVTEIIFCTIPQKIISISLICLCSIAFSAGSVSAADSITFYRDGALLQQEARAVKGTIDIPLAAGLLEHTLTVVPDHGTTILGVETAKTDPVDGVDKELEALAERRRRMEDRLQALETREAIFTSAAKAQSGKAPRKSKANPDPMQAIRQGTDFAIAQLEAVYTARRRATQEIRNIDARLAVAGKGSRPAAASVRITVTPSRGKVTIRYATSERGWQPHYNLHLSGDGTARLLLSARITGSRRGFQTRVSPGALAESAGTETFPVQSRSSLLASYRVPMTEERYTGGIFNRFSGVLTNSTPHYLAPGESGLYRSGTYLGKFRFEGLSSGRSTVISLGK
ncbi:MAG: hypothetical protein HGB35_05330 [Geobacteraceae bacterium]|nr:hypothetical protein [Geobacteraceae bacterium]